MDDDSLDGSGDIGGSAISPVTSPASGSSSSTPFNWSGLFTGLGGIGTAGAGIYTSLSNANNAATTTAAQAAAAKLNAQANAQKSVAITTYLPWIAGGLLLLGLGFFAFKAFRSKGN